MLQNTDCSDSVSSSGAIAYKKRLSSWAVARLLPDTQQEIVARFRNRSDAEGHLRLLRQLTPDITLMVVFDCQKKEAVV
ncbi:hypothetical protein H6G81_33415 [Scytonema hofmannii FACHB-248]|uniref:Uncharacterized protein n=1 Tax=Scytonema hofmannii FACHB-248 TaxID=1842502 RepID=A0ABR8H150_9CYAN|nr:MULTISPECIES: hypothetical protein [Nostocales]MBD2609274.1 hypothetical protein [Scytonema hofmannii FACHB-248]